MSERFTGRKALVTGGTRGIGEAVARQLLFEECSVAITGTHERHGWWSDEPRCSLFEVDFADAAATTAFCDKIRGESFSHLVNNAGAFGVSGKDDTLETFISIMRINVAAAHAVTNAVAENLKANSSGRVVNIASIAAFVTRPGVAAYAASKAALVGLTRVQALDFAPFGVLVNAVCPSYTETEMLASLDESKRNQLLANVPIGRFCRPKEVAELVCFLLSSDNSYITGQALVIDGGVTIK
jgi:NAD(P)-dependent dehydrogenase (short-subunit alcohol dehydrogenase family)